MGNAPELPDDTTDDIANMSIRSLVEQTPQATILGGRNNARDPLDKYTKADMPLVHDAHPTSPFLYINLDLITEWEKLLGEKLLAIPFGDDARNADLHDPIKNRILYAIAEITQSKGVGVSAPSPSAEANEAKRVPTTFLIYNLTFSQKYKLLDRGVWSSPAITFRVTPFFPTNPDYLFTIRGFSMNIEDHVETLVYNIWHDADSLAFAQNLINAAPEKNRIELSLAISAFLESISVTCLNIKERGGALTPRFNIYAKGRAIPLHTTWLELRKYLSKRIYFTPLIGRGEVKTNPFNCGICHGVEHPRGLCPFPDIPGWNGPRRDQNVDNRRGRNGGQYGQLRYGTNANSNKSNYHV